MAILKVLAEGNRGGNKVAVTSPTTKKQAGSINKSVGKTRSAKKSSRKDASIISSGKRNSSPISSGRPRKKIDGIPDIKVDKNSKGYRETAKVWEHNLKTVKDPSELDYMYR